jgi:hypothetical protein
MFGMALSTYHRRVRAAAESETETRRSVWEAVLDFVREHEPASGAAILRRFSRDDSAVVAALSSFANSPKASRFIAPTT